MGSFSINLVGRDPNDYSQDTKVIWSSLKDYDHCFSIRDDTRNIEIQIERGDAIRFLIHLFDMIDWQSYEDIDLDYLSNKEFEALKTLSLNIPLKISQWIRERVRKNLEALEEKKALEKEVFSLIEQRKEIVAQLREMRITKASMERK